MTSRALRKAHEISGRNAVAPGPHAPEGAPTASPPPRKWTTTMVGRAMLAFIAIERIPDYEEDEIRRYVGAFVRFAKRVDAGGIDDDAMPLAKQFLARGYQWLAQNPRYAPVATRKWTAEMVEQLITWFQEATKEPIDIDRALDVAERIHVFDRVVMSGAVDGDAELIADAFLDFARGWLRRQPQAMAHFDAL